MYQTCTLRPPNEEARLSLLKELDLLGGQRFPELDRLTALAADICDADVSVITIYDAEHGVRISVSSGEAPLGAIDRNETVCTHVLLKPEPLVITDALADPVFANNRYAHEAPYLRSYAGVPVGAEKDKPAGVLCVTHKEPHAFSGDEVRRLQKVADLVDGVLRTRLARLRSDRAAARTRSERKRQNLFELIFDAVQEGVNVHAPNGEVVEANPAALHILGLSRDELGERPPSDKRWKTFRPDGSVFPPDEFPVNITLSTGQPAQNVAMGLELPDGELRWITINAVPLHDRDTGAVEYAVVTMKDITAQHEAERRLSAQNAELAEALAEAEKANRVKTDFMGVMSHELRTPMNALLSCATLLGQSRLDPVQRRTLGVLEDAGKQMLVLLNDLLDLSSLNADKLRISRAPVPMLRVIEDAAVIWAGDVRAKGLSLSVMIDPLLLKPREVDSARLLQIIGNLVANAVKFTPTGTVSLSAWPERSRDGREMVAIEVEDTGPGVPPEAAERIFQPFEQIDVSSKRRHGGLGLGLHIARRLAVAMGGDIELETRPELGSRFTVRVEAPLAGQPAETVSAAAAVEADIVPREILCVDDNQRNLFVISAMLRAAGHKPTECASGAEALDLLATRKFDVVLLDMVMPDVDGFDVLARLRETGGLNAATPVIACTANVLPHQIAAYRDAGTTDVIAKPIDPGAMLLAIARAA